MRFYYDQGKYWNFLINKNDAKQRKQSDKAWMKTKKEEHEKELKDLDWLMVSNFHSLLEYVRTLESQKQNCLNMMGLIKKGYEIDEMQQHKWNEQLVRIKREGIAERRELAWD